ncbi:hypothetical protein DFAR_1560004 [Desulfarculales bacterium]
MRNITACQNECANKEGQVTVFSDDECNALKACQDG